MLRSLIFLIALQLKNIVSVLQKAGSWLNDTGIMYIRRVIFLCFIDAC